MYPFDEIPSSFFYRITHGVDNTDLHIYYVCMFPVSVLNILKTSIFTYPWSWWQLKFPWTLYVITLVFTHNLTEGRCRSSNDINHNHNKNTDNVSNDGDVQVPGPVALVNPDSQIILPKYKYPCIACVWCEIPVFVTKFQHLRLFWYRPAIVDGNQSYSAQHAISIRIFPGSLELGWRAKYQK